MVIHEKIQHYIINRSKDLKNLFANLIDELKPDKIEDLYRSIYYMDQYFYLEENSQPRYLYLESETDPVIDRRMMVMQEIVPEPPSKYFQWKISSGFPLVSTALKEHCHLERFSSTFYTKRKSELWNFLSNPVTDPRIRGIYFEELILLTLNISRKKKEEVALMVCPLAYLKKITEKGNYEVRNLNFLFEFKIIES